MGGEREEHCVTCDVGLRERAVLPVSGKSACAYPCEKTVVVLHQQHDVVPARAQDKMAFLSLAEKPRWLPPHSALVLPW